MTGKQIFPPCKAAFHVPGDITPPSCCGEDAGSLTEPSGLSISNCFDFVIPLFPFLSFCKKKSCLFLSNKNNRNY